MLRQETYSNWEGVVGEIPGKQQLTRALQEKVGVLSVLSVKLCN